MQSIIDEIREVLQRCADHLDALWWLIIPASLVVLWTAYKIARLGVISRHDNAVLHELALFQERAVKEGMGTDARISGYADILSKRKSTMGLLLYKYVISHEDFSALNKYLKYDEVLKVARRQPKRRLQYRKVGVLSIFLPLLLLFGGAVALSDVSYDFTIFVEDGSLTSAVLQKIIIFVAAFVFFLTCTTLLIVYKQIVLRFKAEMLGKLEVYTERFFMPIESRYDVFCQEIIKAINPDAKMQKAVKRLVNQEGLQFRQIHHDRVNNSVVSEEEIEGIGAGNLAENDLLTDLLEALNSRHTGGRALSNPSIMNEGGAATGLSDNTVMKAIHAALENIVPGPVENAGEEIVEQEVGDIVEPVDKAGAGEKSKEVKAKVQKKNIKEVKKDGGEDSTIDEIISKFEEFPYVPNPMLEKHDVESIPYQEPGPEQVSGSRTPKKIVATSITSQEGGKSVRRVKKRIIVHAELTES